VSSENTTVVHFVLHIDIENYKLVVQGSGSILEKMNEQGDFLAVLGIWRTPFLKPIESCVCVYEPASLASASSWDVGIGIADVVANCKLFQDQESDPNERIGYSKSLEEGYLEYEKSYRVDDRRRYHVVLCCVNIS
jgi:hypothetical protein